MPLISSAAGCDVTIVLRPQRCMVFASKNTFRGATQKLIFLAARCSGSGLHSSLTSLNNGFTTSTRIRHQQSVAHGSPIFIRRGGPSGQRRLTTEYFRQQWRGRSVSPPPSAVTPASAFRLHYLCTPSPETQMFERYTETARKVIFYARYAGSQFGVEYIDTEHLLLGILRADPPLARRVFKTQQSIESVREQIEKQSPAREKISASIDMPLSLE